MAKREPLKDTKGNPIRCSQYTTTERWNRQCMEWAVETVNDKPMCGRHAAGARKRAKNGEKNLAKRIEEEEREIIIESRLMGLNSRLGVQLEPAYDHYFHGGKIRDGQAVIRLEDLERLADLLERTNA